MTQSTQKLASIGTTSLFTDRVVQQTKNGYRSSSLSEVNHCSVKRVIKAGLIATTLSPLIGGGFGFGFSGNKSGTAIILIILITLGLAAFTAYQLSQQFVLRIIVGKAEIMEIVKRRDLPAAIAFIQSLESAKSCHACTCDRDDDSPMDPIDGII